MRLQPAALAITTILSISNCFAAERVDFKKDGVLAESSMSPTDPLKFMRFDFKNMSVAGWDYPEFSVTLKSVTSGTATKGLYEVIYSYHSSGRTSDGHLINYELELIKGTTVVGRVSLGQATVDCAARNLSFSGSVPGPTSQDPFTDAYFMMIDGARLHVTGQQDTC